MKAKYQSGDTVAFETAHRIEQGIVVGMRETTQKERIVSAFPNVGACGGSYDAPTFEYFIHYNTEIKGRKRKYGAWLLEKHLRKVE